MKQVVIVGAGPAGLAAAHAARAAGASVILLDSADELGGQFWRHLPQSRPSLREGRLHHGWKTFRQLSESLARDPGCQIIRGAHVWAIETGDRSILHVLVGEPDGTDREHATFTPDALILATGAHDRTLPFPGWDLPGVFTAGATQALAKGERLSVGDRVVVAGAGPFLLPVAQSVAATGSRVVAVLEANRMLPLMRGWLARPWQLLGAAGKGVELAEYLSGHLRHRIPYRLGHTVIAAHGTDRVESVTTARLDDNWAPIAGTEKTIAVDAVCVSHAFTPRLELAIAAGCDLTADRFVRVDDTQLTSVAGVYAAGEITGIGGVDLAMAEGELAGHHAAGRVESLPKAARRRRVFSGFAARIDAAHRIRGGWTGWLTESTIVCRCEEVEYGALCSTATATASQSLRSLGLSTRAGLGICQGRICGRTIEELLSAKAPGAALTDGKMSDRRPIAIPIRIGELAAIAQQPTNIPHPSDTPQGSHSGSTKGTA